MLADNDREGNTEYRVSAAMDGTVSGMFLSFQMFPVARVLRLVKFHPVWVLFCAH